MRPQQPDETRVIIPLRLPFVDERGEIQNFLDVPLGSVAMVLALQFLRLRRGPRRRGVEYLADRHT